VAKPAAAAGTTQNKMKVKLKKIKKTKQFHSIPLTPLKEKEKIPF
jgi:hypothetical protein